MTLELSTLVLRKGSHKARADGVCIMEAAAWLAGEAHSDAPSCVCPVLRALTIRLNDAYWPTDADRTAALLPWLPKLVGTAATSTPEIQSRRRFKLADIAVREIAPSRLDRAKRPADAATLRTLPEIVDQASAIVARNAARAVADAAATAYAAYAAYAADAAAYAAYAAYAADAAAYAADAYAADAYAADDERSKVLTAWTNRLIGAALEIV